MIQKNKIERYLFVTLLATMGAWFYLLNSSTPLIGDDMAYCYYYDENSLVERPTSTPISSITQVLPSMWNHYCSVNGRFTSHLVVQIFCGLAGKTRFNVFNTLVFMLFLFVTVRTITKSLSALLLALTFLFVLYGISFPGQTMFWLSGSINYLWSITLSLIILNYITSYKKNSTNLIGSTLMLLGGLFVGWMNESISAGFAGGLFFYFLLNREKFTGYARMLYIGYALGTALIIFSPGTFARATTSGELAVQTSVIQMITMRFVVLFQMMFKLPIILLAVLGLIYCAYKEFRYLKSMPFIYIAIVEISFLWLLGIDDERIYFAMSVIAFILLLQIIVLLMKFSKQKWAYYIFVLALLTVSIPQCYAAYTDVQEYARYNGGVVDTIRNAPKECVLKKVNVPGPSRFVYAMGVSSDKFGFHNRVMSFMYSKDYIQALPAEIYTQYLKPSFIDGLIEKRNVSDRKIVDNVYIANNWMVIPIEEKYIVKKHLKCLAQYESTDDSLHPHQAVIRWLLGTLGKSTEEKPFFYVSHHNNNYCILPYDGSEVAIKIPIGNNLASDRVEVKF